MEFSGISRGVIAMYHFVHTISRLSALCDIHLSAVYLYTSSLLCYPNYAGAIFRKVLTWEPRTTCDAESVKTKGVIRN